MAVKKRDTTERSEVNGIQMRKRNEAQAGRQTGKQNQKPKTQ